jgi:hypothetical protein
MIVLSVALIYKLALFCSKNLNIFQNIWCNFGLIQLSPFMRNKISNSHENARMFQTYAFFGSFRPFFVTEIIMKTISDEVDSA